MPGCKFRVPELSGVSAANSLGKENIHKKKEINSHRMKAQKCKTLWTHKNISNVSKI